MQELVAFYKENADILRRAFMELGFSVYGGANAPYVWVGFPGQACPLTSLGLQHCAAGWCCPAQTLSEDGT